MEWGVNNLISVSTQRWCRGFFCQNFTMPVRDYIQAKSPPMTAVPQSGKR